MVNDCFVKNTIDRVESIEVSSTNSSNLEFIQSSVSKEVCWIGKGHKVSECGSNIESTGSHWQYWVHSIVLGLSAFSIKHQVSHGIVWISVEVAGNIISSIVSTHLMISLVPFQLMCINEVIHELKYGILETSQFLGTWLHIKWEVVISLNAEEGTVWSKDWEEHWLFLKISKEIAPKGWHIYYFLSIKILYIHI